MSKESNINISAPVTFHSWSGGKLSATLTSIVYRAESSGQESVSCTVKVHPTVMQRIYDEQWFQLNGRTMVQDVHFESTGDIELMLTLSPSVIVQLSRLKWDADLVLKSLVEASEPALSSAELWFLIEATQAIELPQQLNEHGQLKIGFFTRWKQELLFHNSRAQVQSHAVNHRLQTSNEQTIITSSTSAELPSASTSNSPLAQQIEQQLIKRQLNYKWHNERIIIIPVAGEQDSNWTELIRIEPEASLIILYAVFPLSIPEAIRQEVAEALMNDNYELMNGAFELDSSDGELRFRSTIMCPDGLHEHIFSQLLADHEQIMEHYIPILRESLDE